MGAMGKFVSVAKVDQIKDGEGLVVQVENDEVALFSIKGRIYACTNTCPHRGGPIGEGSLDGNVVTCPWHGWEFDITTGAMPVNVNVTIKTYDVQVDGGDIKVAV